MLLVKIDTGIYFLSDTFLVGLFTFFSCFTFGFDLFFFLPFKLGSQLLLLF